LDGISLTKSETSKLLEVTSPFLFIDYVDRLIPGKCARGHLNLEKEDWFFKCHLPREQTMPGTLLTEAMLQTLVLTLYTMEGHHGKPSFITAMQINLLSKVGPRTKLRIEASLKSYRRGLAQGEARVLEEDKVVCRGLFTYVSPHDLPRPNSSVTVLDSR
jgi:3-hydroxyacyl-[acyl-carrier-protein] dehydratase